MGSKYKQLTDQDRVFIDIMLSKRYPKAKIATILNVHPSTIYREIKRNSVKFAWEAERYYYAASAQAATIGRCKRGTKLETDKQLRQYVHEKLAAGWSPYQIEGRLKGEGNGRCIISHESIYRYIYSDKKRQYLLFKCLRRKHRHRVKRGHRKSRVPQELLIGYRPESINNRSEFGHWECDLMVFKYGIKGNLITLRERTTRYLLAIKNENKKAEGTAMAIIKTIAKIKPYVKSITFDQGGEFQKFGWIRECIDTDIYFCDPASPQQKGAIENANGVMRIEYPRAYNIDSERQADLNKTTNNINNRPLKCLNYQSPSEAFQKITGYVHEN